jgi:hypothetical protein
MEGKGTRNSVQKTEDWFDWSERFIKHPSAQVLWDLAARGVAPIYVLQLLWAIFTVDPVRKVRKDCQDESKRLVRAAEALEEAAAALTGSVCEKDLELSPSQLRSAAVQIREVFHPAIHGQSNRRRYDSTGYLAYRLYTYLKQFKDQGLYDAIASLVDAARPSEDRCWDADAVRKRIKRLKEQDPGFAERIDRQQEAYVREGNGGFHLRELFEGFAAQGGCDIETFRKCLRK